MRSSCAKLLDRTNVSYYGWSLFLDVQHYKPLTFPISVIFGYLTNIYSYEWRFKLILIWHNLKFKYYVFFYNLWKIQLIVCNIEKLSNIRITSFFKSEKGDLKVIYLFSYYSLLPIRKIEFNINLLHHFYLLWNWIWCLSKLSLHERILGEIKLVFISIFFNQPAWILNCSKISIKLLNLIENYNEKNSIMNSWGL